MHTKNTRFALFAYVVAIHFVVIAIVWRERIVPRIWAKMTGRVAAATGEGFYDRMVGYHARADAAQPSGCGIFIGDSLVQGMSVDAVCDRAVNYGIGSDTTEGVAKRLPKYANSIERADFVFLAIGVNDLAKRSDDAVAKNVIALTESIACQRIFVSSLLPINAELDPTMAGFAERIIRINSKLSASQSHANFVFIDAAAVLDGDGDGHLDEDKCVADGLHLNANGNLVWSEFLKKQILSTEE